MVIIMSYLLIKNVLGFSPKALDLILLSILTPTCFYKHNNILITS